MFHVKHREAPMSELREAIAHYWRRLLGWAFGLITPDPGVRLPKLVIPPDDDVPRETPTESTAHEQDR
jgi:hypothetical protein